MGSNKKQPTWKVILILAIGVLAVSTAAIFVRLCLKSAGVRGVGFSLFIAASRLTIAAVIILPLSQPWLIRSISPRAYYYFVSHRGAEAQR